MKLDEARLLAHTLLGAIKAAEYQGRNEVDLLPHLTALDDQARAELQSAIDAARAAGSPA